MKKLSTAIMGIALLSAVIYAGCKKDSTSTGASNPATVDNDATAAQDEANASFVINDSKLIADGAAKGQATKKPMGGTCATWVGDTSATTDTIDVHFTGLCVSPDGKIRKGDIIVYWTRGKGYFDSTASITQTWRNYSITNTTTGLVINVTGSTNLMNTGKDTDGDHSWKYTSNVTLTYGGTGTGSASWTATRNNVLAKTGNVWYYYVTGSASGTSKSGVTYTLSITPGQPLVYTAYWVNLAAGNAVCGCIESGQETLTRTGKIYPLILTYTSGIGNCNYTATATINGTNYNILVP
ncbi:MAG TPA: hypothetical protein VN922_15275 [Bacteroidia bacterium]|nr:hypothetical protein [Bacteroidia bacterium]